MTKPFTNRRGFTLLEIVLYLSVAAAVLYAASLLYSTAALSEVRNHARVEVEESAGHTLRTLTQAIRNAESVTTPASLASGESLVLVMSEAAENPTTITLVGGVVLLQEGSGSPVPLSSSEEVEVGELQFSNRSETSVSDSIQIEFSMSYRSLSDRSEFEYAETYYGTATTRQ